MSVVKRCALRLVLALTTCACGPSLQTLVGEQRYPEAICKIHHSGTDEIRSAAQPIAALGLPRWRVLRIVPAYLHRVEDPIAAQVFESYVFFQVQTQADPVVGLDPIEPFTDVDGSVRLINVQSIAEALTGEATPDPHQEKVTVYEPEELTVGMAMATVGLSLIFRPIPSHTRTDTVYPTPAELERAAPHAAAVAKALRAIGYNLFAVRKQENTVARIHASVRLEADTRMCRQRVVVYFVPVEVPLDAEQPWPAGEEFRRFEWQALERPNRDVIRREVVVPAEQ